ncbi:MAG: hypothetical protein SF187_31010 [Deltaproteobacteria bacterium]|nr:hypothetical protein [Deltaproteobacteria bacterium]
MRTAALRALGLSCLCLALWACTDDTSKRKLDAGDNASGGDNPDALPVQCSNNVPCPPSGNACVVATCNNGVCQDVPAAEGTACDDQLGCTEADACHAGKCEGKARVCDDGLTCSKDSCDEAMGGCVADVTTCACNKDADCDDKNACTGVETCDPIARTCLNGTKVSCATLDNACNVGMCNPTNGTCTAKPKPSGTVCSDGNACTQNDICTEGTCGGTAITCGAMDQCHTAGVCDPSSGQCSNPSKPNGTTCEDGNMCTRGDACTEGTCAAGTPTTCTASGECRTAGMCDPATGVCSNPLAADGTTCNDGSACTSADTCAAGVCKGAAITCDDGVACTIDSCSETAGCTKDVRLCGCQKNSDCDDGNACNGAETCNVQTLTCVAGAAKDCSGLTNACNVGVCNATSGACEAKPRQNGTTCSDGTACTRVDTCVDGQCRGQNPVVCTASDQCHVAGSCDPQTGACSNPPKPNGATCNDGNACTQTDACQNGSCTGGNPITCTAASQCHNVGTCNPQTGTCSTPTKANGTTCNDGNTCTQTDSCQSGLCGGGNPITCVALDQCHAAGVCDGKSGTCSNPAKANGTTCNDGNACTQADTCQTGACQGANPVVCTAQDSCHDVGVCDPAKGTCSTPAKADGTTCNDGNACTRADVCSGGSCKGGNPVVCVAQDQCHVAGACDATTGTCSNPAAADGTTCNDGLVCTSADKCNQGTCTGAAVVCNDGIACTADACVEAQGGCTVDKSTCGCTKDADCNDGNACNGVETCNQQTLSCNKGVAVNCQQLDNVCNVGTCVPTTGACVATPRADGTTCNDNNACTQTDSCQKGTCTGSNPITCATPDQCHTAGTCNPSTGVCSNPVKPNGSTCNDGNACTQTDTCQSGTCTGANPLVCRAIDQCHLAGVCDTSKGTCSQPQAPNGTKCNDGNACTQTDTCQAGACAGGNPINCTALDQCHSAGTCDPQTGSCSNPELPAGTKCDDKNACTGGDVCQRGVCTPATTMTCTPLRECFDAGVCDPAKGTCSNPTKPDGTACNDSNGCTLSDKCAAGTCGGTAVSCTSPPVCQQGGMCVGNGACAYQNVPDQTNCDDGQGCTLADACASGKCTGVRRSNKSGDWNTTPVTDKGMVTSVNIDNFSKGALVAGSFLGSVSFGNFTVTAVRSTGAYVAFYTTDKTVVTAQMVMQATTSLVVSDITVHADGSFVLVGAVAGAVGFPSNAKLNFTAEGTEWFVAGFSRDFAARWVRRGLRGNGVAVAADAYANRSVMVVGTCDKPLAFDGGSGKTVALNNAGTVAALYDDDGFLKAASVVATQGLAGLKVAVSAQTDLAAVQGTGAGELVIGGDDGFASLGGKDVFVFALTPDLRTLWARQMATSLDDETGGVAAYPGKTGVFVSFFSAAGPKASIRGRNLGTTALHGFDGRNLQGHVVTFNKEGTPINAALIANKSGLAVRAWDVRAQAQDARFTVVGTFNLSADVYGVAGFGDGPPTSNPDRAISHNADGNSLFAARFDSDAVKNTWAINLRGTNAGVGANGNDVTVTVHPDLSATATGMFVNNATFGDQVQDALLAGQGTAFLSHFNAAAEYDYCQ